MPDSQAAYNKHEVYFGLLGLHLFALLFPLPWMASFTKVLLVPSLLFLYVTKAAMPDKNTRICFMLALILSWLGDVALIFDNRPVFFILGLASFLCAHFIYIPTFVRLHTGSLPASIRKDRIWIVLVGLYAGGFYLLLLPHLSGLAIPVGVYTMAIASMLISAILLRHAFRFSLWMYAVGGAILFVLSDTLLAIQRFWISFGGASVLVMATYGLAQWMLVQFAVGLWRSPQESIAHQPAKEEATNC